MTIILEKVLNSCNGISVWRVLPLQFKMRATAHSTISVPRCGANSQKRALTAYVAAEINAEQGMVRIHAQSI
jgi:hypothetical protein